MKCQALNITSKRLIKKLKAGNHILSKNYHDGRGRQYWLRNKAQKTICSLTDKLVRGLDHQITLKREDVVGSDEAFVLYISNCGEF